jgi:hypothetical protein
MTAAKKFLRLSDKEPNDPIFKDGIKFMPCQACGSINYDEAFDDPMYIKYGVYMPVTCDECDYMQNRPPIEDTH